jgi:hypothetical protein
MIKLSTHRMKSQHENYSISDSWFLYLARSLLNQHRGVTGNLGAPIQNIKVGSLLPGPVSLSEDLSLWYFWNSGGPLHSGAPRLCLPYCYATEPAYNLNVHVIVNAKNNYNSKES